MAKAKRAPKPAKYAAAIRSVPLQVPNAEREAFRSALEAIPFLGYEVERLADGRTICITKPGGKYAFGRMKVQDFMVWIYDATASVAWRISHREIREDIEAKLQADPKMGKLLIWALNRVREGDEPDVVLANPKLAGLTVGGLPGEPADAILKVYKWIFGQEDCNYPTGEGRDMAMGGILDLIKKKPKKTPKKKPT